MTGLVPIAHPPGNAIFAFPNFAVMDPRTKMDALIVLTNSYLASKLLMFEVLILKNIFSSNEISAPIEFINSNIVVIS